jgi:hypothetical protein
MSESMGDEYEHCVWRDMAGSGRLVWRWEVRLRALGTLMMKGVSLGSESAATEDAKKAIEQLSRQGAN